MLGYYLDLALRSFRRSKALTALMVLAIALGIGASMTTLTVFHILSGDPIPGKSAQLFRVQLDAQNMRNYDPGGKLDEQLTRLDAEALLRDKRGKRQVMMTGGATTIQAAEGGTAGVAPFFGEVRYNSADFFPMFDVPFRYGQPWREADDEARARVVVISAELNDKLFGGADSTGKSVRLSGNDLRIVGVMAPWRPVPQYYDMSGRGSFGDTDMAFVPFSTSRDLKLSRAGSMSCWGNNTSDANAVGVPCSWIQYWVQLDTPAEARAYNAYLQAYSAGQRAAGRFERPDNTTMRPVMDWLDYKRVVPADVRMQLWLALGFLLVCLVNTVGLLLAKCMRRAPEIGVRRALGASRRQIFAQFVVEAGVVGLAGGALGLLLAMLGLWAVRQNPAKYAQLAHLDAPMLLTTFALALVASLIAGLLPAWRACGVTPALQLKSQ